MLNDTDRSLIILLERPRFVDGRHFAVLVGEGHLTQCCRVFAIQKNGSVLDVDFTPSLQRKARIGRVFGILAHEIRKGALTVGTECLRFLRQGRFEKHRLNWYP